MGPDVTRHDVENLHNETLKLTCAALSSDNIMIRSTITQLVPKFTHAGEVKEVSYSIASSFQRWMWHLMDTRDLDRILRTQKLINIDMKDLDLSLTDIKTILKQEYIAQDLCHKVIFSVDGTYK